MLSAHHRLHWLQRLPVFPCPVYPMPRELVTTASIIDVEARLHHYNRPSRIPVLVCLSLYRMVVMRHLIYIVKRLSAPMILIFNGNSRNIYWNARKKRRRKRWRKQRGQDSNAHLSPSSYLTTLSGGATPQAALSANGSVVSLPTSQSGPNSQRNSFASDGLPAITPSNLDHINISIMDKHGMHASEHRWSSPPSPTMTPNRSMSPSLKPPSINSGVHSPTHDSSQRSVRDEAIYWISKLARSSHPEACAVKARWHQLGKYGMVQSEDKATALYTTASKQNHPRAAYRLGEIFEKKKGTSKAVQYYTRASSQNDALANLRLGKAHLMGELKLACDYNLALRYLRRASDAATQTDKEAHEAPYLLAQLIGDLHPTIRLPNDMLAHDPSGALEQFKRGAELGHAAAMYELAYAYEYACLGLEMAEPDLSIQWYRQAAELGHADAMVGLSGWYLTGLEGILAPDDTLAFDWCYRAAEQHHLPKAEYAIGYYYEVGIGVASDMNEAMRWYELAASHGSRDARFRLNKTEGAKLRKSEYGSVN
ncbi:hypothetical protein BDF22DRAFT_160273 [Syncephalis plumigaleata]|nr:hypothetical protein BDF22DRAFT_160273 [Syncephalis plumigaleata]